MSPDERTATPPTSDQPPEPRCPWCPYTGPLRQVLAHMEAAHPGEMADLGLYPPIAGRAW
jgi:hypothetical protein